MTMSDSMTKLQVLTRAELALAQIRLLRSLKQAAWLAGAGLVGLVTLALLDVAAYHALVPGRGPAAAALLIAAANGVATVVFVAVAQKIGASDTEEKLAVQMRDLAAAEINDDVEQARKELAEISNSVRKVRTGLSAVSTLPFEMVTLVLGNLLRSRKKRS
jgi:hypothetical protein